jgi:hypothetical protein
MRNVVVGLPAIAFALFVSGCGELTARMDTGRPPQQSNLDQQDENVCRSRGATPDYVYGFQECKKQMANERASAEAAAKANPPEGDNNMNAVPVQ